MMGSQHCNFHSVVSFSEMWGDSRKQSSCQTGLPVAEGAAGDCILELHPEHVSRCSELHAKIRLKVVELNARLRSLSAMNMVVETQILAMFV